MKKIYCAYIAIFVAFVDQLSKYMVVSNLQPYHPYAVSKSINLTLAYNTGAAFSFLDQSGPWHQTFFCILSIAIISGISIWIWRKPITKGHLLALSMILGGAIGNLIDRLHFGHVIDFIDLYYTHYHWPVFNIADSAICVGAILYLLYSSEK